MRDTVRQISDLLHEAGETHHRVYRIVDGDDPDWASWYADWLVNLSELPQLLGVKPARSELVYMLVKLERDFAEQSPGGRWQDFYASELVARFSRAVPSLDKPVTRPDAANPKAAHS